MKDDFPRAAIIISGGEGTRLRPLTYKIPKSLVPVHGKPLLAYVMDELIYNGINRMILAIGYKAQMIIDYGKSSEYGDMLDYSIEAKPLGTGGAMKLAAGKLGRDDENFFIINGDQLFNMDLRKLYEVHRSEKALVTLGLVELEDVTGYGVVTLDGNRITRFVEKPKREEAPSHYVNGGVCLMSKRAVAKLPDKEVFSLERDFFEKEVANGGIYGYLSREQWLTADNMGRYKNAMLKWRPRGK